uniref:Cytochrome P450 n=1 Tax=Leersia perrieri TaxID=77586 RepID=A0A0D9XJ07_9ORYZ
MAQLSVSVDSVQQTANSSGMSLLLPLLFLPLTMTLILILPLRCIFSTRSAKGKSKLPLSPPALPLIGHAHLIGSLPHVSLRDVARRHGGEDGLMLLRLGVVPTLVASSMRAAQQVLCTHDRSFASRPRAVVSDVLFYGPSEIAFQPYGERWRQAKRLATTHLFNINKVQSFRGIREEEAGLLVNIISRAAETCTVVDMSKLLNKCTNDIMCCAVAGQSISVNGRDMVFRKLIDQTFKILGGFNLDSFYPGMTNFAGGLLVLSARRKAKSVRDGWSEVLDKVIDEHAAELADAKKNRDSGDDCGENPEVDFIHVLLSLQEECALTRENIKAILFEMLGAGTNSPYLTLEFIMAELMLHQDVMAKLQAEVRKTIPKGQKVIHEDDLTSMIYLKAVIKETLRLHPPVPLLVPRMSHEDCEVDVYTIPAGTTLLVNVWAICRDPMYWVAPEKFMPERFIYNGEIGGVDFRGRDFQFLPFGSGRRMCPAMNYSLASIEIILANLINHFDWELPRGVDAIDMTERFQVFTCRREKLLLLPSLHGITHPSKG